MLNVCATGADLRAARDAAYTAIRLIDWPKGILPATTSAGGLCPLARRRQGQVAEPGAPNATVTLSQPLFVIGAPRSGTTFLVQLLNRHPAIHPHQ